jgi:hypothetical protein
MNIQFYKNGKGFVIEEYGRPELMDYIVDEDQFRLETLSSHVQHLAQKPPEGDEPMKVMQVEDETKHDTDAVMRGNINYA